MHGLKIDEMYLQEKNLINARDELNHRVGRMNEFWLIYFS